MKSIFSVVVLIIGLTTFAHADDSSAEITRVRPLKIRKTSVVLKDVKKVGQDSYRIQLSLEVLPMTSCEEDYIGLSEEERNSYKVVYQTKLGDKCKQFAPSRKVTHILFLTFEPPHASNKVSIVLNGTKYDVLRDGDSLEIRSVFGGHLTP